MINYFNLMDLMEAGSPAFDYAREAFNADFCAECGKIHFNKTTRKNGFSAFKNSGEFFLRDSNIDGLFCTPTSVIFLNNTTDLNTDGAREQDLSKADGKRIDAFSVKRDEQDKYPVLMLRSSVGFSCVLPFLGVDSKAYNVDFKNYMEYEKALDEKKIQAEKAKWTA